MNHFKKIALLIIGLIPLSIVAQDVKPYFSAVIVSDIETSKSWYQKHLGFQVNNEIDMMEERGFKQTNLERSGSLLELIEMQNAKNLESLSAKSDTRLIGFFKIGFLITDFDQKIANLKASEVEFHGDVVMDDRLNMRMVIIKDPDGNRIQLFEAK